MTRIATTEDASFDNGTTRGIVVAALGMDGLSRAVGGCPDGGAGGTALGLAREVLALSLAVAAG